MKRFQLVEIDHLEHKELIVHSTDNPIWANELFIQIRKLSDPRYTYSLIDQRETEALRAQFSAEGKGAA
jgi:hypothetical protein